MNEQRTCEIHIHDEILFGHQKGNPFVTKWMNLEAIRLSNISQRKTNTLWCYLHVEFLKKFRERVLDMDGGNEWK